MQRKLVQAGKEIVKLPNPETPNYKVAAVATGFLAFNTLISNWSCNSFGFWLNAGGTLLSGAVAANQYLNGAPQRAAVNLYGSLFGSAKPSANPTLADAANVAAEKTAPAPSM